MKWGEEGISYQKHRLKHLAFQYRYHIQQVSGQVSPIF